MKRFWRLPDLIDKTILGVFNRHYILCRDSLINLEQYYHDQTIVAHHLRIQAWSEFQPYVFASDILWYWNGAQFVTVADPKRYLRKKYKIQFFVDVLVLYDFEQFLILEVKEQVLTLLQQGRNSSHGVIKTFLVASRHSYAYRVSGFDQDEYQIESDMISINGSIIETDVNDHYFNMYSPDGSTYVRTLHDMILDTRNKHLVDFDLNNRKLIDFNNKQGGPMKFYRDDDCLEVDSAVTGSLKTLDLSYIKPVNAYPQVAIKYFRRHVFNITASCTGTFEENDVLYFDFVEMRYHILKNFKYMVEAKIYVIDSKFLILELSDRTEIWVLDTFQWSALSSYIDPVGSKLRDTVLGLQKQVIQLPQEMYDQILQSLIVEMTN